MFYIIKSSNTRHYDIYSFRVFRYCWFADDVTAAMLIDRNIGDSLRWELYSFICKFCGEKCAGG